MVESPEKRRRLCRHKLKALEDVLVLLIAQCTSAYVCTDSCSIHRDIVSPRSGSSCICNSGLFRL